VQDRLQMTAAISHDLRTPITRLRLRAELVEDDEQRRKILGDLKHMEDMVDSTLAFAREESSREAATSLDLVSLIEDVCEDQPDVVFNFDQTLGPRISCLCRPVAIRRCITNLLDNAVKYGGSARVGLVATATTATIRIEDDGPGIPEADLDRVFRPYERLETSRNEETGGTGLGLSIARTTARAHGGVVRLVNRPGGGLTALVELPRR
jgi:signal transduction histidine kinase